REIRRDVAIDGLRLDVGAQVIRQRELDAAVYRADLQRVDPVRASEVPLDRAIHGARAARCGRREFHAAVDRRQIYGATQALCLDVAVDGASDEAHTRRHLHGEVDRHIVVAHVHAATAARRAFIRPVAVAARINRANRHAVSMLYDVDLYAARVAPPRLLL